jgi:hypothetical protein
MQTYSCRYAKLYVIVHMGYPGDARVIPGGCLKSILKPIKKITVVVIHVYARMR